jgi:putative membrane protein
MTPLQAWFGWKRSERALRLGIPLPAAPLTLLLTIAVITVGALVFIGVLAR